MWSLFTWQADAKRSDACASLNISHIFILCLIPSLNFYFSLLSYMIFVGFLWGLLISTNISIQAEVGLSLSYVEGDLTCICSIAGQKYATASWAFQFLL